MNVTKTVYFFNHTCKFQPVINLKKMIFQRIPFTNIWGCKSDIRKKGQRSSSDHFLIILVDFESKMLYIKIQRQNCRFWRTRILRLFLA